MTRQNTFKNTFTKIQMFSEESLVVTSSLIHRGNEENISDGSVCYLIAFMVMCLICHWALVSIEIQLVAAVAAAAVMNMK